MDKIIVAEVRDPNLRSVNHPNMLYTILSRATTLSGVFLLTKISQEDLEYAKEGVREFAPENTRLQQRDTATTANPNYPDPLAVQGPVV